MISIKRAQTKYNVSEFTMERWSPRAFLPKPVEREKIRSFFEAARWSPSSGNQQPWNFLIGANGEPTWDKIFDCLDDWNKAWVKDVPLLLMSVGHKVTTKSKRENFHYAYDTGQSLAHLTVEAMRQGLYVHQMGGFNPQKAIDTFEIPAEYYPLTVIAIGYLGDPDILEEEYRKSELEPRVRKDFDDFVFAGKFGEKTGLFD
jgi:nitroreductase